MSDKEKEKLQDELYEFFCAIKSVDDFRLVMEDLCTYDEVEKMAQRLKCAKLMLGGNTYNQITASMDVSPATLSRVSRCIKHGSGGYGGVLKAYLGAEGE